MTAVLIDMTGRRCGRLMVTGQGPNATNSARARRWWCTCDCGQQRLVAGHDLRSGHTTSCGCGRAKPGSNKHMPEYAIWCGIKTRCTNARRPRFADYGERGITMCSRWSGSFAAFFADMGPRPSPEHSVERDDVNGGYEPSNCRWATLVEQANNKRNTRRVVYRGVELPLAQAVRAAGSVIHIEAAFVRIRSGWPVAAALETPRLHRSGNAKPWTANDPRNAEVRACGVLP